MWGCSLWPPGPSSLWSLVGGGRRTPAGRGRPLGSVRVESQRRGWLSGVREVLPRGLSAGGRTGSRRRTPGSRPRPLVHRKELAVVRRAPTHSGTDGCGSVSCNKKRTTHAETKDLGSLLCQVPSQVTGTTGHYSGPLLTPRRSWGPVHPGGARLLGPHVKFSRVTHREAHPSLPHPSKNPLPRDGWTT